MRAFVLHYPFLVTATFLGFMDVPLKTMRADAFLLSRLAGGNTGTCCQQGVSTGVNTAGLLGNLGGLVGRSSTISRLPGLLGGLSGQGAALGTNLLSQGQNVVQNVASQIPQVSYSGPSVVQSPSVSYSAPAVSYSPPVVQAPAVSYSAPAPAVSYSAPAAAVSYSAPAPAVSYRAPAPAVSYSGPSGCCGASLGVRGPSLNFRGPSVGGYAPSVGYRGPSVGGYAPSVRGPSLGGYAPSIGYERPTVQYSGPAVVHHEGPNPIQYTGPVQVYGGSYPQTPGFGTGRTVHTYTVGQQQQVQQQVVTTQTQQPSGKLALLQRLLRKG